MQAAQADVASARADAQGKAKVISGLEAKLAAQLVRFQNTHMLWPCCCRQAQASGL